MYRNQWAGFDGNPITALLVADSKIDAIHGAIGGLVRYNQLGQETNLAAKLGYAYHAPVGPGTLQLGLNGEFQHKTLEGNWISASGPDPRLRPQTMCLTLVLERCFKPMLLMLALASHTFSNRNTTTCTFLAPDITIRMLATATILVQRLAPSQWS